jgi:hypothetical protein
MKTPMQEMIDEMNKILREEKECFILDLRDKARELLQKEKEVMCEFAFNCGDEIKDQNNWRSPRNLTNYEVIQDFYNETFNTKEK